MFLGCLFLILSFLVVISFFEDSRIYNQRWLLLLFTLIVTLLVAFRPEGFDKDYTSYVDYLYHPEKRTMVLVEPSFYLISSIALFLKSHRILFVIYAFLAIPLKIYSIRKLSPLFYLSLLVWFSHLFILQDMTQIRVAVSTAIMMFSLPYLATGEKRKALCLFIIAIMFHYSSLFLLPVLLIGNAPLTRKWIVLLLILPIIFYVFKIISFDLLVKIPIPMIQDKLVMYQELMQLGGKYSELNIYNLQALFRLFTYYMLIWKYDYVSKSYPYMPILLKLFCYSICLYAALSFLPVLASRGQELIGIIDVLTIPLLAIIVRPHWLGRLLVIIYALLTFITDIFVFNLFNL